MGIESNSTSFCNHAILKPKHGLSQIYSYLHVAPVPSIRISIVELMAIWLVAEQHVWLVVSFTKQHTCEGKLESRPKSIPASSVPAIQSLIVHAGILGSPIWTNPKYKLHQQCSIERGQFSIWASTSTVAGSGSKEHSPVRLFEHRSTGYPCCMCAYITICPFSPRFALWINFFPNSK